MPEDFSFQLYPDDLERLEWYIEAAMERVPPLGTAGVGRNINGPIPYAPDGLPLMGPMPGVKNAFEAHSFTFGIVQAGGAGKVMAEWIIDGETEWDMWAVDARRYTDHADFQFCLDKAMETYGHEYAMHFPHHQWPAGRNKKLSPNHDRLISDGAQMGAFNGWERACWFAKDGDDTSEGATETWDREGPWTKRVKEECEAVRDGVGVIDMCGFSRFALKGDGAAEWLRGRITGALPKVGRMNLIYFSDSRGRIVTEMSCIRHAEDDFTLMTAAVAQWHDFELLWRQLPAGLDLTDLSRDVTTLLVTGPKSRDLLAGLSDADLSAGWLGLQTANICGHEAMFARVSFVGERGWEIHVPTENAAAVYTAIRDAGATPFGMYALDSLRIEKGYRTWKGDLSTDYTMLQAGLGRFVKLEKPQDFPGKAALQAEAKDGSSKSFVTLVVDAGDSDAPYMSCVWSGDEIVGETTSSTWGYRVNASIALGMVRSDLAQPGTELEVEIYGEKFKAVVQPDQPLWDPENERLRA
jgi:dimethylglycine dehydrogenase